MLFTPKALQKRCPQVLAMPFDLWSKLLQHLLHFITHDCAAVMLATTCSLRVMAPQIEILVNYCPRSITLYYISSKQCTSPLQGHCIFYRQVCGEIVSSHSSGMISYVQLRWLFTWLRFHQLGFLDLDLQSRQSILRLSGNTHGLSCC